MPSTVLRLAAMLLIALQCSYSQNIVYVSPKPNSSLVSLETNIILRSSEVIDASSLSARCFAIAGSKSLIHSGAFILSDDERTMVFLPSEHFSAMESVTVSVGSGIRTKSGKDLEPFSFRFTTTPLVEPLNRIYRVTEEGEVVRAETVPAPAASLSKAAADSVPVDFPKFRLVTSANSAPGYYFLATAETMTGIGNFLMLVDNDGKVAKYKRLPGAVLDFKMQSNGLMSYAEPYSPWGYAGGGRSVHRVLDSTFAVVDSFKAGNGYDADGHAFILLPNGHAILHAYDIQYFDLSKIIQGGNPNAIVVGSILQELDLQKNVVFQWRSWDYIPISDTYMSTAASAFDYIHMDSHELDEDGNFLVSCRNTCDITKINRMTGDIIWRMGGKKNQFTFIGENAANAPTYYTYAHGFNRAPNGNFLLFDNGNLHKTQVSRAVEYKVDQVNKTATMLWEYRHTPDVFAPQRGSVQRLANGNTVIGWGSASFTGVGKTTVTEVTPDKLTVFELESLDRMPSFGAPKYLWNAQLFPAAAATRYELLPSVQYSFKQSDSINTGVSITLIQANFGYNAVTVKRFEFGSLNQSFPEPVPFVEPFRFTIGKSDLSSFIADVAFDSTVVQRYPDMKRTVVYFREKEGNGKYLPLTSVFDAAKNTLTATTTKFGEFVIGVPDQIAAPLNPTLVAPLPGARVNQNASLLIRWSSYGHLTGSHIQIASDSLFKSTVVNDSSLVSSYYMWKGSAKDSRYYWRVRVMNEVGKTSWSTTGSFTTSPPFITITSPALAERVNLSTSYVIRWDLNTGDWVRIGLFRNTQPIQKVVDSVENTGRYVWKIPATGILPDSSYTLRITNLNDTTVVGDSPKFTLLIATGVQDKDVVPLTFSLYQNYPNPFNPTTEIVFSLSVTVKATLRIYDMLGREIATLIDEEKNPGRYTVRWDAGKVASGVYFYRLIAGDFVQTRRMALIE
ncbi:MAG: aryl-sulfate sulfotransferase [Ignavibacteriales bacterium]|nr:aryl-sulfate sulfotransferase [Ignavibacteriales bacterium]